mgnify:CR=1 FL=1|tara:strand:+ start:35 stop:427 length:393 start_codon:yes stop_codon:yes gene_type:complete
MSQDLSFIKNEIKYCEEADTYDDLEYGDHVKYITLVNNDEYFYTGGIYNKIGDNKIYLDRRGKQEIVPIYIKSPKGEIIYKTRFFVQSKKECSKKDVEEYEKIIHTQQQIIEKLNIQLKKQTIIINKLKN